jgi:hypothetical protein
MSRNLTSAVVTQSESPTVRPALFCELEFDSGAVRAWSGVGNKIWDGKTWAGVGNLGGVGPAEETTDIAPRNMTLTLSSVPSELMALALAEPYQGRPGRLWLAFLSSLDAIITDPVQIFSGKMDVMSAEIGGGTGVITVSLESALLDLGRPRIRRYTRGSQRQKFPNDKGFDYVPTIQQAEINWGIANKSGFSSVGGGLPASTKTNVYTGD